nr:MAG TPA: head closure knob [Caudoviricetes sp.]
MLSKSQVVAARKAIESTYIGQCTITEHQKVRKDNGSTAFNDVVVLENQPCKLSFEKIANNNQTNSAAILIQTTKLFIAPEIQIKPGSKITVVQNGVTTEYKSSGEPAMYQTHQEIMLELFKGWS